MKKLILAVAVAGMSLGSVNAFAVSPYLSLGGGVGVLGDGEISFNDADSRDTSVNYEEGWVARAAVGAALNKFFRLEVEGFYNNNDADKVNFRNVVVAEADLSGIEVAGALFNAYYDINFGSPLVPFIGGGIGIAKVDADVRNIDTSLDETVWAWNVGGGLAFTINKNISLELSYRYLATEDIEFDRLTVTYEDNQFLGGVRFTF